jgi:hypothetical protein
MSFTTDTHHHTMSTMKSSTAHDALHVTLMHWTMDDVRRRKEMVKQRATRVCERLCRHRSLFEMYIQTSIVLQGDDETDIPRTQRIREHHQRVCQLLLDEDVHVPCITCHCDCLHFHRLDNSLFGLCRSCQDCVTHSFGVFSL